MSVPFLHSEHTQRSDDNNHTVSSSSSSSTNNRNMNINIINKLNTNTTSDSKEIVESVALASISTLVSQLVPTSDGWTVHTGAGNTAILEPFPPLFYSPTPVSRNASLSFLMLKNTRIPCSGPGSPSSGHSCGMYVKC